MKAAKILAFLFAAAMVLTACGTVISDPVVSAPVVTDAPPVREPYPVSFENENFEARPLSVASLSPAITEILYDIGAQDALVAVSDYCDYPAAAANFSKIGSPARPDIDAIIDLAPELLITQSPIASADILALRQAGIRVLELEQPRSFAELCEIYIKLTMIFHGAVDSQSIAAELLSGIDSQLTAARGLGNFESFVIVEAESDDGLMLSGGHTLCSDMLSVFGYNLRAGTEVFFAHEEELLTISPETVFYAAGLDRGRIEKEFPRSKLIEIDFERFERPTVRLEGVIAECAEKIR